MTNETLERRLSQLAAELEATRREVRALRHERRASGRAPLVHAGLVALGLLALGAQSFSGQAPAPPEPARPSAYVTHFSAPFVVDNGMGKTILEVSDEPGRKGITIYGPTGSTFIGSGDGAGFVQLLAAGGQKVVVDIGASGVQVFGKTSHHALAALKTDNTSGFAIVYNNAGNGVAWLSEDAHHGGAVTVSDPNGDGVFRAGYTGDGGNACLTNGKRGLQCLGIGLPLQIR